MTDAKRPNELARTLDSILHPIKPTGIHPDEIDKAIRRTRNVLTQMLLELSQGADLKMPVWDALSASLALSDLLYRFIRQEEELSDA